MVKQYGMAKFHAQAFYVKSLFSTTIYLIELHFEPQIFVKADLIILQFAELNVVDVITEQYDYSFVVQIQFSCDISVCKRSTNK